MQILRLLNKKFIIIFIFIFTNAIANEPADIWNIDKNDVKNNNLNDTLNKEDKKTSNSTDIKND